MTKAREEEAHALYVGLMEEAKQRLIVAEHLITEKSGLHEHYATESTYLQLRLVCEIIGLACLVAHGDMTASTKLSGEQNPGVICARLFKEYPNFYPVPRILEFPALGMVHLADMAEPYLTREDLTRLYVRASTEGLHKGSLRNLIKKKVRPVRNPPEVVEWYEKVVRLLLVHSIVLIDGKSVYICRLSDEHGRVALALGQAP